MRHTHTSRMGSPVDKRVQEVTEPCIYTFVPIVQKLPIKSCLAATSAASEGKQHENVAEETTREAVTEAQPFRAVYIPHTEEREERNSIQSHRNTDSACTPPNDLMSCSASLSNQSKNTSGGGQTTMEAATNKHTDISQRRHQCVPGRASEVSLGCYSKTQVDRVSPTNSADLFPTPASSRESILSACSDRDTSLFGSRTISPCSSVCSGIFTPSIVPVKKHFLAPGSSLISLPQSLRSSCESLSCPMSPTPTRHRPPLTRLSLLTAILRKGRLPVLSSTVQRPYTPCWPINNITLSHCRACSAASSVASIPFELSSNFSSTTSIDSQSDAFRDPTRCATAPPLLCKMTCPQNQIKTSTSNTIPRWQQVISPPPPSTLNSGIKNGSLRLVPQPVCSSIVRSVSPMNRSYVSVSQPKSPMVKPSICVNMDKWPNKLTCQSPEPAFKLDTGVPQKWTRLPNPPFSKRQSSSQQLKSPPSCPSENVTYAFSPAPSPTRFTAGRPQVPSQSEPKKSHHCLSASRYTPMALSGWPSPGASPSSTPTPSPAPPIRELTPSPCLSLRSTPSPRPGSGISDGSDREGKKRKPHKIKSSYKSLAAIPTNTLLLDQQVIDEQVEKEQGDRGVLLDPEETDTHTEMCSPAWLRKESEELYAVIDEILASSPIPPKSKPPVVKEAQKNSSTFPQTFGRETKYASVGILKSPGNDQRRADETRLIRSVTTAPRLTSEHPQIKSECSPWRHIVSQHYSDSPKGRSTVRGDGDSKGRVLGAEERSCAPSECDLHITEPEEPVSHPPKHGPSLGSSTSFYPAERKLLAFQTQI
ncbi:uncharacterized protein mlip isoform X2 [Eucyclogobius newberryi]|uniref:uncharacterized protein mlip isoform X2 n=1 Tax=Eucyclogobius newberryi TaxID=166745 RepID=UPI003B5BEFB1